MDMFLLFAVIFLCLLIGVGLSALMLSLLFRAITKISGATAAQHIAPVPATSQAPPAL